MLGNNSSSSDWKRSPSLKRSNNDQGRRSKEVSPKVREPLKEHSKRKKPKSRNKSSNNRNTDEGRSPSPKRWSKKSKKRHRSRSKKNKKKKHRRYLSSPSPSSSSNDDSNESKYRNNENKESTDSQILDLGWFLRRISTNTACLQIWHNTPTLILILISKRQT